MARILANSSPSRRARPSVPRRLLAWYGKHRRPLPWRRSRDPYRVWVSEVMLQQTQVATVIPYYRRFLERFPTLGALAAARPEEVLSAWSGLGYYRRARSLHAAAREVAGRFGGKIPRDPRVLRELPGVGSYTAGAVASIAFGLPEPALDGNVQRVLARLLALRGDPGRSPRRKVIEETVREMLRQGPPGEINQALMELGALICAPGTPRCGECPLGRDCRARRSGLQALLPETSPSRPPVRLEAAVALVRRRGSYLMVRRAGEALMQDLWEFPGGFLRPGEDPEEGLERIGRERLGASLRRGKKLASLSQTITYRRVRVTAFRAVLSEPLPRGGRSGGTVRWVHPDGLPEIPHGSLTRRILERIGGGSPPGSSFRARLD